VAIALQHGCGYVEEMLDVLSGVPGIELTGTVEGGLAISEDWSLTNNELLSCDHFSYPRGRKIFTSRKKL
jgi:hypothetical protein